MTKVITKPSAAACLCLIVAFAMQGSAQDGAARDPLPKSEDTPALSGRPAEALYLKLHSVGLDRSRVYHVRNATIDRAAIHITLEDGTIAFTEDVEGRITGAFFEGDGDVLLMPPNQVERASMMLFTGAAILEERFVTAYFRFNDDTYKELQPSLRPEDGLAGFVPQWQAAAHRLAEGDALRLFMSFSHLLPSTQSMLQPETIPEGDRMLHAHIQGTALGAFDLYYDSLATEQIRAGQLKTVHGANYYDLWTSFAVLKPAGNVESISETTAEGGQADAIDISKFKIRADVSPPNQLHAEAWLRAQVRQGGQRAVLFELSRALTITSVETDGHAVEFIHNPALEGSQLARRGNDLVAVVFPEPLRTGQKLELHFVYGGEVLSAAGGGLLYVGARGTWYPNRGLAMADFDLEFHYPPGWTLVATGKQMDVPPAPKNPYAEPADAEQVSRWVSERPIPLAGFNLGKYKRATAQAGAIQVAAYAASEMEDSFPKMQQEITVPASPTYPGKPSPPVMIFSHPEPSPARNAQPVADASVHALEFFGKQFGPYPYSNLKLTQMPGALSQGWPSLIYLSSLSFLSESEQSQLEMDRLGKTLTGMIVAHETAHQWWGDFVVWSGYRDQWIMEGLADYSSLLLLESQDPAQFRAVMDKRKQDLLQKNTDGDPLMNAGPVTLGVRLSSSHFPHGYEAISYGRGAWLLHMLHCMLLDAEAKKKGSAPPTAEKDPEDPFLQGLRKVLARYEGKAIATRELLKVFEEDLPSSLWYEGRKSLDWFYEGWVQGMAVPRIELSGVRYNDTPRTTVVTGKIQQKDAPKDLVTSVPIYAVLNKKNIFIGRVFAEGRETSFRLMAPLHTRKVVLDPNRTLLAQIQ